MNLYVARRYCIMPNQESPLPKLDSLVAGIRTAIQEKLDNKLPVSTFTSHVGDTSLHLSAEDRVKINNIITNADAQATYATINALNSHVNDGYIHLDTNKVNRWNSKAEGVHTHEITDINMLREELDAIRDTGGVRHLTQAELTEILVWN